MGAQGNAPSRPGKQESSGGVLKDWSNRRAALFGGAVAICVAAWMVASNTPNYVPAPIYQSKPGESPQLLSDLTEESADCDAAIRSMLLSFADQIDAAAEGDALQATEKTQALVENEMAIIPAVCQRLIDPKSVSSVGNLTVAVQSLKLSDFGLKAVLTIENNGQQPTAVAYEHASYLDNANFSDDRRGKEYDHYEVAGVFSCRHPCGNDQVKKFTRLDPGSSAIVTVEAMNFDAYVRPRLASLTLTMLQSDEENAAGTVSFGFYNVPIDN